MWAEKGKEIPDDGPVAQVAALNRLHMCASARTSCFTFSKARLMRTSEMKFSRLEQGIRDLRATGTVLGLPGHLACKAEAFHLADRTSEALEAINEAEALAERIQQRFWS